MERLSLLQREYDENAVLLANPLDLAEFERLKERRQALLREARMLAQSLNILEPQWFTVV
jgi:hypothetical protein